MNLNPLTRMQVTEREKKIRQKLTIYVLLRLHLSCPVITIWHLQLPLIYNEELNLSVVGLLSLLVRALL
jgi:hypothetical protein